VTPNAAIERLKWMPSGLELIRRRREGEESVVEVMTFVEVLGGACQLGIVYVDSY
jgi:hypothetical protein